MFFPLLSFFVRQGSNITENTNYKGREKKEEDWNIFIVCSSYVCDGWVP